MGFLSVVKGIIFRNEIAADVSADNGFEKLVEWWGLDSKKPRAIAETTYFTCLKVLSETMGKMPLKFYQEDESGGRVRAPTECRSTYFDDQAKSDYDTIHILVYDRGKL